MDYDIHEFLHKRNRSREKHGCVNLHFIFNILFHSTHSISTYSEILLLVDLKGTYSVTVSLHIRKSETTARKFLQTFF